ncbi:MAG: vancomycin high temperature exclusion protein [Holophagaceae bacterium]
MNLDSYSNLTLGFAKQKRCEIKAGKSKRLFGLFLILLFFDVQWALIWFPKRFEDRIFTADRVPQLKLPALILGNSVTKNGDPGKRLEERLTTGKTLWFAAKVTKLILSGDGRSRFYNEPKVMANWMKIQGIPEDVIVQDIEGTRTRESLYRIKSYYKIDKILLVTSKSHIARALYLSDVFGIDSIGVIPVAEDLSLMQKFYATIYEYFAIHKALIEQIWYTSGLYEGD